MTENDFPDPRDEVFVTTDPQTSDESTDNEDLNVLRIAGIAVTYGDPEGAREVADELAALGFAAELAVGARTFDPRRSPLPHPVQAFERPRSNHWLDLNEFGSSEAANAFLVAALGSPLERESAAAAAVLHRIAETRGPLLRRALGAVPLADRGTVSRAWDGAEWQGTFRYAAGTAVPPEIAVAALAEARLAQASNSADDFVREMAEAAFLQPSGPLPRRPTNEPLGAHTVSGAKVSTMVHGTRAFKGAWWRPGGSFFTYVEAFRADLCSEKPPYDWSGILGDGDRERAGEKLWEWATNKPRTGLLHTVFAHSYGAEVAARAMASGVQVDELIMLSAPVTRHVLEGTARARRVVDVRLRFDPVLVGATALAGVVFHRVRQRMPLARNVTEYILPGWTLRHGATHDERVWAALRIKDQVCL
jgi:hypothetical protein